MLYLKCTPRTATALTIANSTRTIAEVKLSRTAPPTITAAPGYRLQQRERESILAYLEMTA
jgi:hypothetical protein